jgi:hypothetical protein
VTPVACSTDPLLVYGIALTVYKGYPPSLPDQDIQKHLFLHSSLSIFKLDSMGQAISAVRETLTGGDEAANKNLKDQLNFLVNAANSKLDKYQGDLDEYVSVTLLVVL